MPLIRKSLLGLLVLSLLYALAVAAFPGLSVSQNQNQDNYIKAEQYLYSDSAAARPVTVVGTSLSARLVMDSLPDFNNLAFGGMSASDGLAIVDRRERKPEMLLLETNLYYKTGSADFLEPLFNPVNYSLKKYLVAFRSDKQPIALATSGAIAAVKGLKRSERDSSASGPKKEVLLQQRAFEEQLKAYATLPEQRDVQRELAALKTQIQGLEKQGVKVAFLEVPINAELVNSLRQTYTRRQFRQAFPPERYTYVPVKVWNFKTTDGLHMNRDEASRYSGFLHEWYFSRKKQTLSN